MLNPDIPAVGITPTQATILPTAAAEAYPCSASALNNGKSLACRWHLIEQLVRAGLLEHSAGSKKGRYLITPDGRALAVLLEKLESARE